MFLDGSLVRVGRHTSFSFRCDRRGDTRLRLESGRVEAFVTRQKDREFIVSTAVGEVQVVGTRFTVATMDDESVSVVVKEGRVRLRTAAAVAEAAAGQSALMYPGARGIAVTAGR
jgi:transmembrane sensor